MQGLILQIHTGTHGARMLGRTFFSDVVSPRSNGSIVSPVLNVASASGAYGVASRTNLKAPECACRIQPTRVRDICHRQDAAMFARALADQGWMVQVFRLHCCSAQERFAHPAI